MHSLIEMDIRGHKIVADRVPNSEKVLLKGAEHLSMFERQDEYRRVITDWVERLF